MAGSGVTYRVIEGKVHIHERCATVLHLPGIDRTQITFTPVGRDVRLR